MLHEKKTSPLFVLAQLLQKNSLIKLLFSEIEYIQKKLQLQDNFHL